MMKYLIVIFMLLTLVLGCAPVTITPPPTATPPVAPSTPTTTTPSAPAAVTPAPPPPAAKILSFESETYTDDVLGFTWQYPKNWLKVDPSSDPMSDDVILVVARPPSATSDRAGITVIAEAADLSQALKDHLKAAYAFLVSMDFAPAKAITLADGKTPAIESIATLNFTRSVVAYYYSIGFNKGGKTIVAWGMTWGMENKQNLIKEIAQTLAVK